MHLKYDRRKTFPVGTSLWVDILLNLSVGIQTGLFPLIM